MAPVALEIQLTTQQQAALEYLSRLGIFGASVDEVAEYLITDGLRDLWSDGLLNPIERER